MIIDSFGLWNVEPNKPTPISASAAAHLYSMSIAKDDFATLIFRWWVSGNVDKVTSDGDSLSDYRSRNQSLKEQIQLYLISLMGQDENLNIEETQNTELSDNGYTTGYELLHGTNRDVGNFHIQGSHSKVPLNGYCAHVFMMKYTWNDIIDPNLTYVNDARAATVLRYVTNPKNYSIHISWKGDTIIDVL